ncbi:hypothetical protein ACOMHN_006546 [Nucella lapillus]
MMSNETTTAPDYSPVDITHFPTNNGTPELTLSNSLVYSMPVIIAVGITLSTITLLTIVFNLGAIIIFSSDEQLTGFSDRLVLNMLVADCSLGIFVMPLKVILALTGDVWVWNRASCKTFITMDTTFNYTSLVNTLMYTMDHYFHVRKRDKYEADQTLCLLLVMSISPWVGVFMFFGIPLIIWDYIVERQHQLGTCEETFSEELSLYFFYTFTPFVPIISVPIFDSLIYFLLRRQLFQNLEAATKPTRRSFLRSVRPGVKHALGEKAFSEICRETARSRKEKEPSHEPKDSRGGETSHEPEDSRGEESHESEDSRREESHKSEDSSGEETSHEPEDSRGEESHESEDSRREESHKSEDSSGEESSHEPKDSSGEESSHEPKDTGLDSEKLDVRHELNQENMNRNADTINPSSTELPKEEVKRSETEEQRHDAGSPTDIVGAPSDKSVSSPGLDIAAGPSNNTAKVEKNEKEKVKEEGDDESTISGEVSEDQVAALQKHAIDLKEAHLSLVLGAVLVVTCTPFESTNLVVSFCRFLETCSTVPTAFLQGSCWFVLFSSTVNPVLIFTLDHRYRAAFFRFLKRVRCKTGTG